MDSEMKQMKEETLSSEQIFNGRVVKLSLDRVCLPDGNTATREYVRHPGGVCVLPLDKEGFVTCVRQYRYPHAEILTELPAGKLNAKQENHEEAALRELREETGFRCGKLTYLGRFYPSPAILDEVIYLYLAENLTPGETQLDDDEFLLNRKIPLQTLVNQVLAGEIADGKTQAAVLRVAEMLRLRKEQEKNK